MEEVTHFLLKSSHSSESLTNIMLSLIFQGWTRLGIVISFILPQSLLGEKYGELIITSS